VKTAKTNKQTNNYRRFFLVPTQSSGGAISCTYEVNCIASRDLPDKEPWIVYEGSNLEATIGDLRPGTKYSIAVRSVNKAGVSTIAKTDIFSSAFLP